MCGLTSKQVKAFELHFGELSLLLRFKPQSLVMLLLSGLLNANGSQALAGANGSKQRKSRGDRQSKSAREGDSKSGRKSGYSSSGGGKGRDHSKHEHSEQKVAVQQEEEEFVPRFTAVLSQEEEGPSNEHSASSSSLPEESKRSSRRREGKEKKEEEEVVKLEEKEEKREEPVTFRMTAQQRREEEIAESLFQAVSQIEPLYAGKVTGILLDGGYSEAQSLLSSSTKLRREVEEAKSRLLSKGKANAKEKAAVLAASSSSSSKPVVPKAKVAVSSKVATFDDMGLPDNLLRGVYAYGFEKPSKCQMDAAGPLLNGKDLILQSQTGTGKTAAYLIPLLARIDLNCDKPQVLILCHSRELALQVHKMAKQLNAFHHVKLHLLMGGTSAGADIKALQEPVQMLVGVPGRVTDMIQRSALDPSVVKTLVLDDGEQLLSRNSRDVIHEIFQACPSTVQSVVCCVTAPPEVLEMCSKFMRDDGVRILIPKAEIALDCIRHYFVNVDQEQFKLDTLCDILSSNMKFTQCLIFCNTSRKVDWLTEEMRKRNFTVDSFHGNLEQRERERAFMDFVRGNSRVLICTGALSSGVDMPRVSHVMQFDFPRCFEEYIQRAGRAGRFGRKGTSLSFVTQDDAPVVKETENLYSIQIAELPADISEL